MYGLLRSIVLICNGSRVSFWCGFAFSMDDARESQARRRIFLGRRVVSPDLPKNVKQSCTYWYWRFQEPSLGPDSWFNPLFAWTRYVWPRPKDKVGHPVAFQDIIVWNAQVDLQVLWGKVRRQEDAFPDFTWKRGQMPEQVKTLFSSIH